MRPNSRWEVDVHTADRETPMSVLRKLNASQVNMAFLARSFRIMIGLASFAVPVATFGQNLDCTRIVPANPLSETGLATPYQLTGH